MSLEEQSTSNNRAISLSGLLELSPVNNIISKYYHGFCENSSCVKISKVRIRLEIEFFTKYFNSNIPKMSDEVYLGFDSGIEVYPILN